MIHDELIREYLETFPKSSPISIKELSYIIFERQPTFPGRFSSVLNAFRSNASKTVSICISIIDDTFNLITQKVIGFISSGQTIFIFLGTLG
jgi:hypothetical protein